MSGDIETKGNKRRQKRKTDKKGATPETGTEQIETEDTTMEYYNWPRTYSIFACDNPNDIPYKEEKETSKQERPKQYRRKERGRNKKRLEKAEEIFQRHFDETKTDSTEQEWCRESATNRRGAGSSTQFPERPNKYRIVEEGESPPQQWDNSFRSFNADKKTLNMEPLDRIRPVNVEWVKEKFIRFVNHSEEEQTKSLRRFQLKRRNDPIKPVRAIYNTEGWLKESFFSVEATTPISERTVRITGLLDTGATRHLTSRSTAIKMFGEEVITNLTPFRGSCISAAAKQIEIIGSFKATLALSNFHKVEAQILVNDTDHDEFIFALPGLHKANLGYSPNHGLIPDTNISMPPIESPEKEDTEQFTKSNKLIWERYWKKFKRDGQKFGREGIVTKLVKGTTSWIQPQQAVKIKLRLYTTLKKEELQELKGLCMWFEPHLALAEHDNLICPNQLIRITGDGTIEPVIFNSGNRMQECISRTAELGKAFSADNISQTSSEENRMKSESSEYFDRICPLFMELLEQENNEGENKEACNSVVRVSRIIEKLASQETLDKGDEDFDLVNRFCLEKPEIIRSFRGLSEEDDILQEKVSKITQAKAKNKMENLFQQPTEKTEDKCEPSKLAENLDKKVLQIVQKQEKKFDPTSFGYGHHNEEFRPELQKIIDKRIGAFAKYDLDIGEARIKGEDGKLEKMTCEIDFKKGAKKCFMAKYQPIPKHYVQSVNRILSEMVKAKVIARATAPRANHQLLFVKKKNNDATTETCSGEFAAGALLSDSDQLKAHGGFNIRVVINLIHLNRSTVPLQSLLTPIRFMFDALAGAKVISILDQHKAFWSLSLSKFDKKYMGFSANKTQYVYERLPMGFINSSAYLANFYEQCFKDMDYVHFYSDNIVVISKNETDHLQHLDEVFRRVEEANIRLSLDRSHLMCTKELEIFGFKYNVQTGFLTPAAAPLKKIEIFPTPSDRKTLKGFLGQILYYSHIAEALSDDLAKLYPLTSQNRTFVWEAKHQASFERIKRAVLATRGIYIASFDPKEGHKLHVFCDAGPEAVGGKLEYVSKTDSIPRPLMFYHQCSDQATRHRPHYYRELLGLADMLLKFEFYLAGAQFFLHTDCRSLVFAYRYGNVCDTVASALEYLNSFQYEIVWESAQSLTMKHADHLSRVHSSGKGTKTYLKTEEIDMPDFEEHKIFKSKRGSTITKEDFSDMMNDYLTEIDPLYIEQTRSMTEQRKEEEHVRHVQFNDWTDGDIQNEYVPLVKPTISFKNEPLFTTQKLPRCLLMQVCQNHTKGELYETILKQYRKLRPKNLRDFIETSNWEVGDLRYFKASLAQTEALVLIICTKTNSYDTIIDRELFGSALGKIPDIVGKFENIDKITCAPFFTGIVHGQPIEQFTSAIRKHVAWAGKFEIFKRPKVGSKKQAQQTKHQRNFADTYSSTDSRRRWAVANAIDRKTMQKAKKDKNYKSKQKVLLKQVDNKIQTEDRQLGKETLESDEFKFFAKAAYLLSRFPQGERLRIEKKWQIKNHSNPDWEVLFNHADGTELKKEIEEYDKRRQSNENKNPFINKVGKKTSKGGKLKALTLMKKPTKQNTQGYKEPEERNGETRTSKEIDESDTEDKPYTANDLLSDTSEEDRSRIRRIRTSIDKNAGKKHGDRVNSTIKLSPGIAGDKQTAETIRELSTWFPNKEETKKRTRNIKDKHIKRTKANDSIRSTKETFSSKHNILIKETPWQQEACMKNNRVTINNSTQGDTFQSPLETIQDPKLIYTPGPALQLNQLRSQQVGDSRLRPIIRTLRERRKGEILNGYFLTEGVLCYQFRKKNQPALDRKVIVIPESAARALAFSVHMDSMQAHPGRTKMKALLRRQFKIMGINRIVKDTIANCITCPSIKDSQMGCRPKLTTRHPKDLGSVIYCDILTLVHNKHKIIIYTHATSQLSFYLYLDIKADDGSIKQQIWDHYYSTLFPIFGPSCLISDNERLLAAGFMPYRFRAIQSPRSTTIPKFPAGNVVERINKALIIFLKSAFASRQLSEQDMKSIINLWLYSHNHSVSSADNLSPIEKFSISRHKSIEYAGLSNYEVFSQETTMDLGRLLEHQQNIMRHIDQVAENRKQKAYEKFGKSKYSDINSFQAGDIVMLRNNVDNKDPLRKMAPDWLGPYCVTARDGLMLMLSAFQRQHIEQELRRTTWGTGENLPLFKQIKVHCDEVKLCPTKNIRKTDMSFTKAFPPLLFWHTDMPNRIARQNLKNFIKSAAIDKDVHDLHMNNEIYQDEHNGREYINIVDNTPWRDRYPEESREVEQTDEFYEPFEHKGHMRDSISLSLISGRPREVQDMITDFGNEEETKPDVFFRCSFQRGDKDKRLPESANKPRKTKEKKSN